MKAIRCAVCGHLVKVDGDIGELKLALPVDHNPDLVIDGFAEFEAEAYFICLGSKMLGEVVDVG